MPLHLTRARHYGLFLLLLLSASNAGAAEPEPQATFERWYALHMMGQPVGWMHVTEATRDGLIESASTYQISIKRGQAVVELSLEDRFVETAEGKPVRAEHTDNMGGAARTQTVEWTDEGATLTVRQGERVQKQPLELQDDWRTPAALQRFTRERLAAGEKQIVARTMIFFNAPLVIESKQTIIGPTEVEVLGKIVPAVESQTTTSVMPNLASREYLDDQARLLRGAIQLGALSVDILAADEAIAREQINPPDLVASLMVEADHPIAQHDTVRKAKYVLSRIEGGDPLALPDTAIQRATTDQKGNVQVIVDVDAAEKVPQPPDEAYRRATAMIDSDDPVVRALTTEALQGKDEISIEEKIRLLHRFTHDHIQQRDMSVGYASASEAARTRKGDCTEHAVLLAAMLRAAEIPSRTVSGLIYTPAFLGRQNVFAYHMWTQAWVADADGGGRWLDLDATREGLFNATHITLSVTGPGADDAPESFTDIAPLLGNLHIRVIETSE